MNMETELSKPRNHKWQPIEDLPANWQDLCDPGLGGMVKAWMDQQDELKARGVLDGFLQRLKRQWAIETGAIEEIYRISEGATKTLIEHGLDAALISHDEVDDAPQNVVAKIKDQLNAVDGLYTFVSAQRPFSKSYIRELHQVITANQVTYEARNTLGQRVQPMLPRGEWKRLPNNVEGPDGFFFEFCPPEQVESEIDKLISLYQEHQTKNISPEIESAWLHHRFVLTHPFTDGNGRIARCLATLVLLKAGWLPFVVTRQDKPAYIEALRAADKGDLSLLVKLVAELQKKAIRQALSIGEDTLVDHRQFQGVMQSIRLKFEQRKEELGELAQRAMRVADSLQSVAWNRLRAIAQELNVILNAAGRNYFAAASSGESSGDRAHYNQYQIVECAQKLGYFANLQDYRSWAGLSLKTDSRFELLFAFHGIGHGTTGVMACAAMTYSRRSDEEGHAVIGEVNPLNDKPFEFTYAEDPQNVQRRFIDWLESSVTDGLKHWNGSQQ